MPLEDRYTDAPPEIAAEINASVAIGDDFPSPEELQRELKRSVTIRLDPDVYAWFQLPGPGYQTRINAVLRRYMEQWKADKAKARPAVVARYFLKESHAGKFVTKKAGSKAVARKPTKKGALMLNRKKVTKVKKNLTK